MTFRRRGMRLPLGDPLARRLANEDDGAGAAPLIDMAEPELYFSREAS